MANASSSLITKAFYWVLSFAVWLLCAGLIYIGGIMVLMAPILTSRGNIDYVAFSPERKHAAKVETIQIFTLSFLPLGLAYLGITRRRRMLRRFIDPRETARTPDPRDGQN